MSSWIWPRRRRQERRRGRRLASESPASRAFSSTLSPWARGRAVAAPEEGRGSHAGERERHPASRGGAHRSRRPPRVPGHRCGYRLAAADAVPPRVLQWRPASGQGRGEWHGQG